MPCACKFSKCESTTAFLSSIEFWVFPQTTGDYFDEV